MSRYPNAADVERVSHVLGRRPRTVASIASEAGLGYRKTEKALSSLRFQRRALRIRGAGWRCRR